jgi:hypothetical protein
MIKNMGRVWGWLRLFLLPVVLASLFGFVIFGVRGAVGAALLMVFVIGVLSLSAEERLIRFYSARISGNRPYLRRRDQAIERVLRRLIAKPPRLFIIDSPESLLYVTRNAWGRGSIFISEGWISTQDEKDLPAWLSFAVSETQRRELVLQTLACHLADRVRRVTPKSWIEFMMNSSSKPDRNRVSLSSLEMLWGLICFLLIQYFLSISNPRRRGLDGIFQDTYRAVQKQAFCFAPLRLDSDEYRYEVNQHSLLIQEKLV